MYVFVPRLGPRYRFLQKKILFVVLLFRILGNNDLPYLSTAVPGTTSYINAVYVDVSHWMFDNIKLSVATSFILNFEQIHCKL